MGQRNGESAWIEKLRPRRQQNEQRNGDSGSSGRLPRTAAIALEATNIAASTVARSSRLPKATAGANA
jgi:hypothetical protein